MARRRPALGNKEYVIIWVCFSGPFPRNNPYSGPPRLRPYRGHQCHPFLPPHSGSFSKILRWEKFKHCQPLDLCSHNAVPTPIKCLAQWHRPNQSRQNAPPGPTDRVKAQRTRILPCTSPSSIKPFARTIAARAF